MIRVFQTKFTDAAKGVRGDSFRACLASLLQVASESLPAIEDMPREDAILAVTDLLHEHDYIIESRARRPADGYVIVGGEQEDGRVHHVISFGPEIVHNPDPLRRPLKKIDRYWVLRRHDDVAMENDPPPRHERTQP